MAAAVAAKMRATAESLVMAFNGPWTEETLEKAMAGRAEGCVHAMLPASLNLPPKSNEEWATHFKRVIGTMTDSKTTLDDVVVAPDDRRVVVRSSMTATATVGPFKNEYVWFFTFDESGTEIVRIDEMLDSLATKNMFDRMAKYREQQSSS